MTWDTEESSAIESPRSNRSSQSGYDSAVLWSDDPENAYFRSVLKENRAGKTTDSLIGDSTLGDLLDENTLHTNDAPLAGLQSGLSYAEDDTLARIEPDQRLIQSGWLKRRKEAATESEPVQAVPIAQAAPITPPPRMSTRQRVHVSDTYPDELPVIRVQGEDFPSYIFVTAGHSSAVKTKERTVTSTEKSVPKEGAEASNNNNRRQPTFFYGKLAIILLLVAVIISMIMLALILTQKRKNDSNTSQFQNVPTTPPEFGFAPSSFSRPPTPSPTPFPPTEETRTSLPTSKRITETPSAAPVKKPSSPMNTPTTSPPTKSPTVVLLTASPTVAPTFSPTASRTTPPIVSPTSSPTVSPTPLPTRNPSMSSPAPQTTEPTTHPTQPPVASPVAAPITSNPTKSPSRAPTNPPTKQPTKPPTSMPTTKVTKAPTSSPTTAPTRPPVVVVIPTPLPSPRPTPIPTKNPTLSPTNAIPNDVLSDVLVLSPDSALALSDTSSPQYRALEWAVRDSRLRGSGNNNRMLQDIDTSIIQRWVLATLYYSTRGERWINRAGWLSTADECAWFAIECNTNGEITAISMQGNDLVGPLPLELHLLSDSLEFMAFNSNRLNGRIPTTFGLLTNLERLSLNINQITGSVPSQLSGMSRLGLLGLGRNNFNGTLPTELGNLDRLKVLDVSANNIQGTIPTEYARMQRIEALSLQENRIGGQLPTQLGGLLTLEKLDVSLNNLNGNIPSEYGSLLKLEYLTLHDNPSLSGRVPSELGRLLFLETLYISGTSLTGEVPDEVCQLPLAEIEADCEEVKCTCCDYCCIDGGDCYEATQSPTKSPTPEPTFAPTPRPVSAPTRPPTTRGPTNRPTPNPTKAPTKSPTASPTYCTAEISTDKHCYVSGEDIVVTFENCNSREDDWIGVYASGADRNNLGDPLGWVWSCGSRFCTGSVEDGEVTFHNARGRGQFEVFLVRRNPGGPYVAYGIGNEFQIANFCE